jgi:DNA-binding CsgD family transcriptional regulator
LASFETLVNSLSQGVICLSAKHRISWATKRAREYLQTYCGSSPQMTHLPPSLLTWLGPASQREGPPAPLPKPLTIYNHRGHLIVRLLKKKSDNYLFLEEIPIQRKFGELTSFGLTEREAEVLGWIAQGKSNDEVAVVLGVCSHTVKKHLERIYDALGVGNRTEAALKVQTAMRQAP